LGGQQKDRRRRATIPPPVNSKINTRQGFPIRLVGRAVLWDMVQLLLNMGGRAALGFFLALVLSIAGIVVAWGLYIFIFTGVPAQSVLLAMFTVAAGIGAGVGGFLAWRRLDRETWPLLAGTLVLVLLAGIGGGWGGYIYGANREVECCAQPTVGPLTFTAVGAAVGANGIALLGALLRDLRLRRRSAHSAGVSSAHL